MYVTTGFAILQTQGRMGLRLEISILANHAVEIVLSSKISLEAVCPQLFCPLSQLCGVEAVCTKVKPECD